MKKILVIILLLFPFIASPISVGIGSVHGKSVTVLMKNNSNNPKCVCIPIDTKDGSDAELWIKMKDVSKFRGLIFEARMKYNEWVQIANENNVGDFSKDLPVSFFWTEVSWRYGEYHLGTTKPKLVFIKKDNDCYCILTCSTQSYGNRFITANFSYIFHSEDDFTEWFDVLSHDNIQTKLSQNTNFDFDKDQNNIDYDKLFK